ncbi:MAG: GspH/FimT family pseudopilin [Gammaproteobacteria bacterium]
MYHPRSHARGISLWESLATLSIVATLTAAALPSFDDTFARARLVTGVNSMVGSLHFARSAAILRNIPTAVCLSGDGARCLEAAGTAARGWLVFYDVQRGGPVRIDAPDTLLRRIELPGRITVQGSRAAVTYWPTARAGTTSTFLVCHAARPREGRAVVVSQTGRPRTVADGSWTERLRCSA